MFIEPLWEICVISMYRYALLFKVYDVDACKNTDKYKFTLSIFINTLKICLYLSKCAHHNIIPFKSITKNYL